MPNRCVYSKIQWLVGPVLGSSLNISGYFTSLCAVSRRSSVFLPAETTSNNVLKGSMSICLFLSFPPSFHLFFLPSFFHRVGVQAHAHIHTHAHTRIHTLIYKLPFVASLHKEIGQVHKQAEFYKYLRWISVALYIYQPASVHRVLRNI